MKTLFIHAMPRKVTNKEFFYFGTNFLLNL
jgi:hypothetical protein